MADIKNMVDGKIAEKKVMVFSKSYCPFCTKAKKVFQKMIANGSLSTDEYEIMEIENNQDCDAIQAYLLKLTGAKSVPRVFINQKCVGGGDDVEALDSSGELKAMLS